MTSFSLFNMQKKSPKRRFFLIMGWLFFLNYLTLGLVVLLWKSLPLSLSSYQRYALSGLLIVYALFRLYRYYQSAPTDETQS